MITELLLVWHHFLHYNNGRAMRSDKLYCLPGALNQNELSSISWPSPYAYPTPKDHRKQFPPIFQIISTRLIWMAFLLKVNGQLTWRCSPTRNIICYFNRSPDCAMKITIMTSIVKIISPCLLHNLARSFVNMLTINLIAVVTNNDRRLPVWLTKSGSETEFKESETFLAESKSLCSSTTKINDGPCC